MKISLSKIRLTPDLRIFLVIASILMIYFNYPEGSFPAVAVLAIIPFCLSLKNADIKEGFFTGLLFGFLFYITLGQGLVTGFETIHNFGFLKSRLLTVAAGLMHAVPYPVFGIITGYRNKIKKPLPPFHNAVYLSVLQTTSACIFPITPAHTLYNYPVLCQILDIGGLPLLLFCYNWAGFLASEIVFPFRNNPKRKSSVIILAAIILTIAVYGIIKIENLNQLAGEAGPGHIINIISIQPDIPIESHYQGPVENLNHIKKIIMLTEKAIKKYPGQELIVWPELPFDLSCGAETPYRKNIFDMLKNYNVKLAYTCDEDISTKDNPAYHNTASYLSNTGRTEARYYKQILVPFGEYLPYEDAVPVLRKIFPGTRYYISGNETQLFSLGEGKRIIPTICYEIIYTDHIKKFAEAGGNIILNMSNDAWFGESQSPLLHLSMAIFRAVEYRMPLIRVTNSGRGCFVQPTGEIVNGSLTPAAAEVITSFPLFIPGINTTYMIFGIYFKWFLIVFSFFDAIFYIFFSKSAHFVNYL
jgi:apolipoprotein N-acyltransferase